ncbi:DUF192 domain-containing protein [Ketobacter sp.]|uniref:DUF192 domain-containing protein n=1 Tax=Ketobacter sp. TaxID=2083498 RepID=UPI000F2B647C|nr:MAG: DUF192 domain-containing protein [Ketobacter sp.]
MVGVCRAISSRTGKARSTGLARVRTANTFWSRFIGLLNRSSLAEDEGLLITPCASIHTFFMRFTIDLVFLGQDNRVLGVSSNVRPYRIRLSPRGTCSVLEIAQGNVKKTGIHLDDRLIFD